METSGDVGGEDTGSDQSTGSEDQSIAGAGEQGVSGGEKATIVKDVINEIGDSDMDRVVTLKINGKEEKMPLREALKVSRMEKASQAKMQEAATMQKQFNAVMQMAKTNPREFLQRTGIDPYEFAESTLAEKYEMMQMSPDQRKMMEYERRVKEYEERETNEKQTQAQRVESEARSKVQGELEKELVEAWKDSGLPVHKYFAARISAEMLSSMAQKKAGLRDQSLNAKEAASIVKESVVNEFRDIILSVAQKDPAAAQKLLGDNVLKIFRDYDVKRVTGQSASQSSSQNRPANAASGKSNTLPNSKSMSERQWNEYFKKL